MANPNDYSLALRGLGRQNAGNDLTRDDMSPKGMGFYGNINGTPNTNRPAVTEFSVGVNAPDNYQHIPGINRPLAPLTRNGAKYYDIPSVVPGLNPSQLKMIQNEQMTPDIEQAAINHAYDRQFAGKSPWAGYLEPVTPMPNQEHRSMANTNDPMYGFNNPSMRQPPSLSSLPRGLAQSVSNGISNNANFIAGKRANAQPSAYDLTKQNMNRGYGLLPAVGLGVKDAIVNPTVDSLRNVANTGLNAAGKVGNYLFATPNSPDQPPSLASTAQAAPPPTQAPAVTQKPIANQQITNIQPAAEMPTPETAQQFIQRANKADPSQKIGYAQMPGNPGNQPEVWQDERGFHTNMMQGLAGKTTMPQEGIIGYDTNGKPLFNRTNPATYTIQDGQVNKFDQNGQPVGLSAFAASPDSGKGMDFGMSKEQRAALPAGNPFLSDALSHAPGSATEKLAAINRMSGQAPQLGMPQAPQMPDYSSAIAALSDQIANNQASSSDSIGTLAMKGINRRAAMGQLNDMIGAQGNTQNFALGMQRNAADYAQNQQNNLLDMQKAQMAYQNDALARAQQQAQFNAQNQMNSLQAGLVGKALSGDQKAADQYQRYFSKGQSPYQSINETTEDQLGNKTTQPKWVFNPNTGQHEPVELPGQQNSMQQDYQQMLTAIKKFPDREAEFRKRFEQQYGGGQ